MDLRQICNEKVSIEYKNGEKRENIAARVTDKAVIIPDAKIPLEEGDVVLRPLPSGVVERLNIIDPGFYAAIGGAPAHYQAKYQKGSRTSETRQTHVTVSGNNSRVNIHSVDNSMNVVNAPSGNVKELVSDLTNLRLALLSEAESPDQYVAIGHVASAEVSAAEGDGVSVNEALAKLGAAGRWVFDVATKIGTSVIASIISAHLKP